MSGLGLCPPTYGLYEQIAALKEKNAALEAALEIEKSKSEALERALAAAEQKAGDL